MNFKERYFELVENLFKEFDLFLQENKDKILVIDKSEYTTKCECLNNVFNIRNDWWYIYHIKTSVYNEVGIYNIEIWDYKYLVNESIKIRTLTCDQMWNDLFFSFKWIGTETIKFSWYNDNDWWTKYKPLEIERDWIKRQIDYDKNRVIYIWKTDE